MHTLGGTAKAAAGINVSEDIFAGEARCLGGLFGLFGRAEACVVSLRREAVVVRACDARPPTSCF